MRMLGTVEGERRAKMLVSHLLTLSITTQVEATEGKSDCWDIWVREEERVEEAKGELVRFLADPDNELYVRGLQQADAIIREQRQRRMEAVKNIQTPGKNWRGSVGGGKIPPLTLTLLLLCIGFSLVKFGTENTDLQQEIMSQMMFVDRIDYETTKDPLVNLKQFQLWRLVTPIFLHGDAIHLLFNSLCLVFLGKVIEQREGTVWFAILVLSIAVLSNFFQGVMPAQYYGTPLFVGISGVTYGLFGYVWLKSSISPMLMPRLATPGIVIMMVWLIAGFLAPPEAQRMANLCHLGGLLSGFAFAFLAQNHSLRSGG